LVASSQPDFSLLVSNPRGGPALRQLDQRTIAVRLVMPSRERVLRGRGVFAIDCNLGGQLEIHCSDSSGPFQFVLEEKDWTGSILSGVGFGCDYLLHLDMSV
jgi:hypothetical protein